MDIDGVLTPGHVVVLDSGEEIKSWHVRDRFGFVLARQCKNPFRFAWISGRQSNAVRRAAQELKIDACELGTPDKGQSYVKIKKQLGVEDREVAFIGDDLTDLPVLSRVGLACSPHDASKDIRQSVHYVTSVPGGQGVFREVLELILQSQGLWKGLLDRYRA